MGNCFKTTEEGQEVQERQPDSQQMAEAPRKTTVPKLKNVVNHKMFERRRTQQEYSQQIRIFNYEELKKTSGSIETSVTN